MQNNSNSSISIPLPCYAATYVHVTKQLKLRSLQFHSLYSNSTRRLHEVILSLQTLPPRGAYWKRSVLRNGKGVACETSDFDMNIQLEFCRSWSRPYIALLSKQVSSVEHPARLSLFSSFWTCLTDITVCQWPESNSTAQQFWTACVKAKQ